VLGRSSSRVGARSTNTRGRSPASPRSQEFDEVLLSWLAECEPVEGEGVAHLLVALPVD
jgi:hypothetical protein